MIFWGGWDYGTGDGNSTSAESDAYWGGGQVGPPKSFKWTQHLSSLILSKKHGDDDVHRKIF